MVRVNGKGMRRVGSIFYAMPSNWCISKMSFYFHNEINLPSSFVQLNDFSEEYEDNFGNLGLFSDQIEGILLHKRARGPTGTSDSNRSMETGRPGVESWTGHWGPDSSQHRQPGLAWREKLHISELNDRALATTHVHSLGARTGRTLFIPLIFFLPPLCPVHPLLSRLTPLGLPGPVRPAMARHTRSAA